MRSNFSGWWWPPLARGLSKASIAAVSWQRRGFEALELAATSPQDFPHQQHPPQPTHHVTTQASVPWPTDCKLSPEKYCTQDADVWSKDCSLLHNTFHLGAGPAGDHWGLYVSWQSCTDWGYSSPGKQVSNYQDVPIKAFVFPVFCYLLMQTLSCRITALQGKLYWGLRNLHHTHYPPKY